ncbi:MAG: hypothetical protein IPL40_03045 [Proteobacteria bacterium]|nr:hypothetical protein [Pseudomonadota bacterium]
MRRWWQRQRLPVLIYLITLLVYMAASGSRLKGHSPYIHYVVLAQDLLHGRMSLAGAPPDQEDWAVLDELTLVDGRRLRGVFLQTGGDPHRFKTTRGQRLVVSPQAIRSRRRVSYVSFPWLPAVLLMPFVALWGLLFNDVLFDVLLGALNPVLVYLLLRQLQERGHSRRSTVDNLWLTGLFAFGTVHFYSAVIGQTWYMAHMVGTALSALYALAALDARRPALAGLALGLGFLARAPIPFAFPFIVGEVLRRYGPQADPDRADDLVGPRRSWSVRAVALWRRLDRPAALRALLRAALPACAIAGVAGVANYLRFDSPFEFGHAYLNVRWTERIQRWGLFNYHFLSRNLAALFVLLPRILPHAPFVQISHHGLSIFLVTPIFAYLIWPQRRSPLQPALYLSALLPLILHLLYQNSGWQQFGFRFSLDFTVYLIMLLAVGGYRLGPRAKALILWAVAINTFGAITFFRMSGTFYYDDLLAVP